MKCSNLHGSQYSPSDAYKPTASSRSTISMSEFVDQMAQLNAIVVQLAQGRSTYRSR